MLQCGQLRVRGDHSFEACESHARKIRSRAAFVLMLLKVNKQPCRVRGNNIRNTTQFDSKFHHHLQKDEENLAPTSRHRDLIFESDAFGVIFLEPCFRGVGVREDLEMLGVTDLLARVDVDEDCHCSCERASASPSELRQPMRCGDSKCDQRSDSERCFGCCAWRE